MAEFRFFLDPEEFLNITASLDDVVIIGRRFTDSGLSPGYYLLDDRSFAAYQAGRFREMIISIQGKPLSAEDWDFLDREEPNLLVVEGGRLVGDVLEGWKIRTFAKRSNAVPEFRRLKGMIKQLDGAFGFRDDSGTFYPEIFVAKSARKYRLSLRI
ncbi:MAG: hypothetical protein K8R59_05060 [Thermoanaerobaculales bacterium]|nr:hypothetical protein [Thermoanaerobaculales bacterium]